MKVVDRFKRRILDLAIRGKLVPQDPNDEPASELLARIMAKKAKDERGGRGRKGKHSAVGSDGAAYEKSEQGDLYHTRRHESGGTQSSAPADAPFELPDGWAWVPVDDVTELKRGRYITRSRIKAGEIPVILGGQEPAYYCDESNHDGPCVVVSRSGASAGYASYWDCPIFVTDGFLFECHSSSCETRYFFYWLRSLPLDRLQRGTGIPHVRSKDIKALSFPLPPLDEQKRIVARIGELFSIADSLGRAADGLAEAAKCLDRKILDLAIRGKLVPQDPTDEPASELLKRIAAASHKSPCKNHEAPIDPPFDIPESWVWIKLGSLVNIISGVSYTKDAMRETGIRILRGGNLDENAELSLHNDDVFVSADYYDMNNEVHSGDIVIVASTGSSKVIGRPAIARSDLPGVQIGAFLRIVRSNYAETAKWIAVIFRGSYYRTHIQKMSKGTNIKNLKATYISELLIPLSPLEEQKRIVSKIGELRKVTQMLTM